MYIKKMAKKIDKGLFSAFIGMFVGIIILRNSVRYGLEQTTNEYEKHIGKTVVFKTDTLMIIDCSLLNGTCKLESGIDLNLTIIKTLAEIK